MQAANEIAHEGVLEEGALVVGLQPARRWLAGERVDHVTPMQLRPMGGPGRTSFVESKGISHDEYHIRLRLGESEGRSDNE